MVASKKARVVGREDLAKGNDMFCLKCGAQNADGFKFCLNCGAELPELAPQATPAPQAEPPAPDAPLFRRLR